MFMNTEALGRLHVLSDDVNALARTGNDSWIEFCAVIVNAVHTGL